MELTTPSDRPKPKDASLWGRIGAARRLALYDPHELTRAANRANADRFEREVDPEGKLSPAERQRRASEARRSHMLGLAERSRQARANRKGGR